MDSDKIDALVRRRRTGWLRRKPKIPAQAGQARPLIGITCSRVTGGAWGIYSLGHFMDYTFSDYSQAVLHAGGAPLIVPSAQDEKSLETILGSVQGLILSGGPDIHPRR